MAVEMLYSVHCLIGDCFDTDLAVSTYELDDKRIIDNGGISFGIQYHPEKKSILPTVYPLECEIK